uniref:Uncharacterized protein n=1 Tax=Trypanosoma congolense (strain IL3000) TaxID=1068625 RepID=G0UMT1_TRYCI|nr:hypothetical protein, unlikely [Trypanosoma congolense IL3000]
MKKKQSKSSNNQPLLSLLSPHGWVGFRVPDMFRGVIFFSLPSFPLNISEEGENKSEGTFRGFMDSNVVHRFRGLLRMGSRQINYKTKTLMRTVAISA